MFNASRLRRSAILGALACALLTATTTAVAAAAQPNDDANCRVQLGAGLPSVPCYHERDAQHKSTLTPSADSPRPTAPLAQERYYSSYGEPEPITAPLAPAPPTTPWLTIALAATVALAAASIAAIHRRRLQLRRRVARATT